MRKDRRQQKGQRESQQISCEQETPNKPTAVLGPRGLSATLEQLERSLVDHLHETLFKASVPVWGEPRSGLRPRSEGRSSSALYAPAPLSFRWSELSRSV